MLWVTAEDFLGLLLPTELSVPSFQRSSFLRLLVRLVDILHGYYGKVAIVAEIAQCDSSTGLDTKAIYRLLRHVKRDGHGEQSPICEAVVRNDT